MMVKLHISNLDYTITASRLRREFENFGKVTGVVIPAEPGAKKHKGFGFVTFADSASAEEAISKMDRSKIDGRTLRVNESMPRGERPANFGRRGAIGEAGCRRRRASDSVQTSLVSSTPSDGTVSLASGPSTFTPIDGTGLVASRSHYMILLHCHPPQHTMSDDDVSPMHGR
jgi:RNA recognition motif-containing protein